MAQGFVRSAEVLSHPSSCSVHEMVSEVDNVTHYLDNHDKLYYWQKYTSIYTATALLEKHKLTAAVLLVSQRIVAGESVSPRIDAVMGQDASESGRYASHVSS